MPTRRHVLSLLIVSAGLLSQPAFAVPTDDTIRRILVQRVDVAHQATGIVVGIVDASGRRIVAHGTLAAGDARPLNGDTLFEIGSITKTLTSLLLADMVQRGEVTLDEPVSALLPRGAVRVPQRGGRQITLVDLATHTAALPRMPVDFVPGDLGDPYGDYSVESLYAFLSAYSLPRDIGTRFEYSNLGVGLLGHALALRAGKPYEALLHDRITGPLGLRDTMVTLTPAARQRLAVGHGWALTPVDAWTSPTLTGAGFVRSTANDMLSLLEAFIGLRDTALAPAMKRMVQTRRPGGFPPATEVGLSWMLVPTPQGELVWNAGITGGYKTFIGYDPQARVGVVVLGNAATRTGVNDIGLHLLDAKLPLADPKPVRLPSPMTIDADAAQRYVGRYGWKPHVDLVITSEGGRLLLQLGSARKYELFPDHAGAMFIKEAPSSVAFDEPESGPARAVIVRLFGHERRAWRID